MGLVDTTSRLPPPTTNTTGSEDDNSVISDALSVAARTCLAAILLLTILLGSLGNGVVCMLVYRKAAMRSAINVLVAHLALADILLVLIVAPFVLAGLVHTSWSPGVPACALLAFVQNVLVTLGTLILLAISMDRYLIIVRHREKLNARRARGVILASWAISLFTSLPPLVGWGRMGAYPGHILCEEAVVTDGEQSYVVVSVLVTRLLPFVAMFFSCTCIVLKVRKNGVKVRHYPLNVSVTQTSRAAEPQPRSSITVCFYSAQSECEVSGLSQHTPILGPLCCQTGGKSSFNNDNSAKVHSGSKGDNSCVKDVDHGKDAGVTVTGARVARGIITSNPPSVSSSPVSSTTGINLCCTFECQSICNPQSEPRPKLSSSASTRALYHFCQDSSTPNSINNEGASNYQKNESTPDSVRNSSANHSAKKPSPSTPTSPKTSIALHFVRDDGDRTSELFLASKHTGTSSCPKQPARRCRSDQTASQSRRSPGQSSASTRCAKRTVSLASGLPRRALGSTRRQMLDVSFKTRAFKTILLLSMLLVVCWAPYTLTVLVTGLTLHHHPGLLCVLLVLGLAKSALKPVVYAVRIRKFRAALRLVLPQALSSNAWCSQCVALLISKRRVNPSNVYRCSDASSG